MLILGVLKAIFCSSSWALSDLELGFRVGILYPIRRQLSRNSLNIAGTNH
jgi:hypothetical protein